MLNGFVYMFPVIIPLKLDLFFMNSAWLFVRSVKPFRESSMRWEVLSETNLRAFMSLSCSVFLTSAFEIMY